MTVFTHSGTGLPARRTTKPRLEDREILELVEDVLVEVEPDPRGTLVLRCTEEFDISPDDVELLRRKLFELHVRTGLRWWASVSPMCDTAFVGCSTVIVQAPYQQQLAEFAKKARAGIDSLDPKVTLLC